MIAFASAPPKDYVHMLRQRRDGSGWVCTARTCTYASPIITGVIRHVVVNQYVVTYEGARAA